jgi:hypothetical protein
MKYFNMSLKEVQKQEIIKRSLRKEITVEGASKINGLSERQIYRLRKGFKEKGIEIFVHGNRGRISNNRIPDEERKRIADIIRKNYHDFRPTFATEKLAEAHNTYYSPETVRGIMIEYNIWKPKKRKSIDYRQRRERKEHYGEMIQFDGSYHDWFEKGEEICLLAGIDDATSAITHLMFVKNENLQDIFSFCSEYFLSSGKPLKIYLDKLNAYYNNLVEDKKENLTKFQRAMKELDIEVLTAHSAQAKGRVERLFNTLQDRLVKEMRLKGISNKEDANRYLKEEYITLFNKKYAKPPTKKGNFHRKLTEREKELLPRILSDKEQRVVHNDFCILYKNRIFQLLKDQPATVRKKDKVIVEKRMDGSIWIELRDKYLNFKEINTIEEAHFSEKNAPWILAANIKEESKKVEINR